MRKFYLLKSLLAVMLLTVSSLFAGVSAQTSQWVGINTNLNIGAELENPLTTVLYNKDHTVTTIANGSEGETDGVYLIAYTDFMRKLIVSSGKKIVITSQNSIEKINFSYIGRTNTMRSAKFEVAGVEVEGKIEMNSSGYVWYWTPTVPVAKNTPITITNTGFYDAEFASFTFYYSVPTLTVSSTEADYSEGVFDFIGVEPGVEKSFTFNVQGVALENDITFSSENNFFTFTPSTITAAEAAAGVTVTAKFTATETGSAKFTVNSDGAVAVEQTVNYMIGMPDPVVALNPTEINLGQLLIGLTKEFTFNVDAQYLKTDITLGSDFGCTFSINGETTTTISKDATFPVTVTASFIVPVVAGAQNVTVSTTGIEDQSIPVNFTVKEPVKPSMEIAVYTDSYAYYDPLVGDVMVAGTPYYVKLTVRKGDYNGENIIIKGNAGIFDVAYKSGYSWYSVGPDENRDFEYTSFGNIAGASRSVTFRITPKTDVSVDEAIVSFSAWQNGAVFTETQELKYDVILKPVVSVDNTTIAVDNLVKNEPATFKFTVKAENLYGDITLESADNFISFDKSTITKAEMTADGVEVTGTFTPAAAGSNKITIKSDYASNVTVTVNYTVLNPVLSVDKTEIELLDIKEGSSDFTFVVKGSELAGDITFESADNFFTFSPATIAKDEMTADGVTVTGSFSSFPAENGEKSFSVKSKTAADVTVTVKYILGIPDPVITVAPEAFDNLGNLFIGFEKEVTFTVDTKYLQGDVTFSSDFETCTFTPESISKDAASAPVEVTAKFIVPSESGVKNITVSTPGVGEGAAVTKTIAVTCNVVEAKTPELNVTVGTDLYVTEQLTENVMVAGTPYYVRCLVKKMDYNGEGFSIKGNAKNFDVTGGNSSLSQFPIAVDENGNFETAKFNIRTQYYYYFKVTPKADIAVADALLSFAAVQNEKEFDLFSSNYNIILKPVISKIEDITLNGLVSGATAEFDFTVKAENLHGDITLSSDNNFFSFDPATIAKTEMTETGVAVKGSFTVPAASGVQYIHLKSDYAENAYIKVVYIVLNPTISVDKAEFTLNDKVIGSNAEFEFIVNGTDLTDDITFESADNFFTFAPATIAKADMTEEGVTVKGSFTVPAEDGEKTFTIKSNGADDVVVKVTYTVVEPTTVITIDNAEVTVDGTFLAGADVEAKFTVKAADLKGDITFEAAGVTFTPDKIAKADMTEAGVEVTASFKAAATKGENTVTITVKSEGAEPKTVTVKYTVTERTGVENVTVVSTVWSDSGMLFIEAAAEAQATVYTLQGQKVETLNLIQGVNTVALPSATYIVKVGETAVKVSVR